MEKLTFHPLIECVLDRFKLTDTIHGPDHWARVLENGMRLAPLTGADPVVVSLFAIFHDSCRLNDGADIFHGGRAGKWVKELGANFLGITVDQHDLLIASCAGHTNRLHAPDVTMGTCWDADRLDIARIGTIINPRFMSTMAAKDPGILAWAQKRSEYAQVPEFANSFI